MQLRVDFSQSSSQTPLHVKILSGLQTFAEQLQEESTEQLVFIRPHHVNEIPTFSITVTFIA
jgi:hypothetical protein